MHIALMRSNMRYDDAGRLVELVIGSRRPINTNRNVTPIYATTLRNLALRWQGLPEEDKPAMEAAIVERPKTSLVPSQVLNRAVEKAASEYLAANAASSNRRQSLQSTTTDASESKARVVEDDTDNTALGADIQDSAQDGHVDLGAAKEEDLGEAIALTEFETIAEVDGKTLLTEEQILSAGKIAKVWKRFKGRLLAEKRMVEPEHIHLLEVLAIVKRLAPAPSRYQYMQMLITDFFHIKAAMDAAVKESEVTKRKVLFLLHSSSA